MPDYIQAKLKMSSGQKKLLAAMAPLSTIARDRRQ